jgi:membrane-bound serine protease (ClpP class)
MNILMDPNIAYLLLAVGLVCAVLSLLTPGTGVLELVALFALLLAGVSIYNLPINLWSLIVLLIGVVLFLVSLRYPKRWYLLAGATLALVIGSAFLFVGDAWWQPAVDPILATTVSVLSAGFFWLAARKTMEAWTARPNHDLGGLVGQIGEAKSTIHEEGSVQVAGELWSARSATPIPNGAMVRIIQREGFILDVEAIDP